MSRHYILTSGRRSTALPMKVFDSPAALRPFSGGLGWKVFQSLSEPACPMDVAKKLGVHEQKVYYYIRKFREARLISEVGREPRKGTVARFYQLRSHAFGVRIPGAPGEREVSVPSPAHSALLEPFIASGTLNARIVVGSPDPHGPWKARSSDACCAIDLALFLGAFTRGMGGLNYKLDTEIREPDLSGNLILIGGPAANMMTNKANPSLPVRFDTRGRVSIVSDLSGKSYREEEHGLVVIAPNPWADSGRLSGNPPSGKPSPGPSSQVLVLAGNRFQGTRAAIIACITDMEKLMEGNRFRRGVRARVVKGFDLDGDGIIDSAEIVE
jgi:hypothetical protein